MSSARLRDEAGRVLALDAARWIGPLRDADHRVLDLVDGPVLDVGCGPGRHVSAVAARGLLCLGIDVSEPALVRARGRGVPVLERSVFDRVPGAGRWGTVLLLDGNVGIGGRPAALLRRVRALLRPYGRVLVELAPDGVPSPGARVRFELDGDLGPWFEWTHVTEARLARAAPAAGLTVRRLWRDEGRTFAWLE